MQAAAARHTASGGDGLRARPRCWRSQFHQSRQESGQRLARAGRRDQQRRTIVPRLRQEIKLMDSRRPSPRRKPAQEIFWQQIGRYRSLDVHGLELSRLSIPVEGGEQRQRTPRLRRPLPSEGSRYFSAQEKATIRINCIAAPTQMGTQKLKVPNVYKVLVNFMRRDVAHG